MFRFHTRRDLDIFRFMGTYDENVERTDNELSLFPLLPKYYSTSIVVAIVNNINMVDPTNFIIVLSLSSIYSTY